MKDYKDLVSLLRQLKPSSTIECHAIGSAMIEAAKAIEQLVKERDMAIADLKTAALNCHEDYTFSACFACEHNSNCNGQPSSGCKFEWCGVREVEHGND